MLDPTVRMLAKGRNFAAFTTLLPGGNPSTHIMWVDAEDDHILVNTEVHRRKYKNITLDPRVAITVLDAANPYRYAEVRGRVVDKVTGPAARDHIDELSHKYTGKPYDPAAIRSERVILRIQPERQRVRE